MLPAGVLVGRCPALHWTDYQSDACTRQDFLKLQEGLVPPSCWFLFPALSPNPQGWVGRSCYTQPGCRVSWGFLTDGRSGRSDRQLIAGSGGKLFKGNDTCVRIPDPAHLGKAMLVEASGWAPLPMPCSLCAVAPKQDPQDSASAWGSFYLWVHFSF